MPDYNTTVDDSITPVELNKLINNVMKGELELKYKIYLLAIFIILALCFCFIFL